MRIGSRGVGAGRGVDRAPGHRAQSSAEDRRAPVERRAATVADAAEPALADGDAHRATPMNATRRPSSASPAVPSNTSTTASFVVHVEHDPVSDLARVEANLADLVPADPLDALDHEQRAADRRDSRCARRARSVMPGAPARTSSARAMASTASASSGGASSARGRPARGRPPRSSRAGTPRSTSSQTAVVKREHQGEQRGLLRGLAVSVVGAQRALLEHRLAQQAAGEQHDPLAVGQRAGADELRDRLEAVGLREESQRPLARSPQSWSPWLRVPRVEGLGVARRGVAPAHGRVVTGVGEIADRATTRTGRSGACAR